MRPFRIKLLSGTYLLKGDLQKRLEEETHYIIFAASKADAQELAFQFVAEKITDSSPHVVHAAFDQIADLVESLERDDPRYKDLCDVLKEAALYSGSISIGGAVLVCPQHEAADTLIVPLSEGDRKRVLLEIIYQMDKAEGGLQWSDEKPLNGVALAKAVQALF